ncbi:MAG: serine/threonine-protein kinase, partial [Gammaproteobacteria bacterium]
MLSNAKSVAAPQAADIPLPLSESFPFLELQRGYRLNWYEIVGILGRGGFGITYLARDIHLDREVAIKEYLPNQLAIRESDATVHPVNRDTQEVFERGLRRFIEEARTLANFDHPNIVRVLMEFEDNNTAYMVMHYEGGRSLQEVLAGQGTLEEAQLLGILMPILDGLEQVHEAGFIHRDIKPANILLRDDGSPVLLDFGSATQSLGVDTKTLTTLVSPGYAAFEQYCSDANEQGAWTDIYGLGATAYHAVTGRVPVCAVDRSHALFKNAQDALIPARQYAKEKYSAPTLAAIDHALTFSREQRPQSIAQWRREFTRAGADIRTVVGLPAAASAAPAIERHRSAGLRHRRATLLGLSYAHRVALLLVLPMLAFGWFYWFPQLKPVEKPVKSEQAQPDPRDHLPVRVAFADAWKDGFFGPETMVIFSGGYRIGSADNAGGRESLLHRFVRSGRAKTLPVKVDNLAVKNGIDPGNALVLDLDPSTQSDHRVPNR